MSENFVVNGLNPYEVSQIVAKVNEINLAHHNRPGDLVLLITTAFHYSDDYYDIKFENPNGFDYEDELLSHVADLRKVEDIAIFDGRDPFQLLDRTKKPYIERHIYESGLSTEEKAATARWDVDKNAEKAAAFTLTGLSEYELICMLDKVLEKNRLVHYGENDEKLRVKSAVRYIDGFYDMTLSNPSGYDHRENFESELRAIRKFQGFPLYTSRQELKNLPAYTGITNSLSVSGLSLEQKQATAGRHTGDKWQVASDLIRALLSRPELEVAKTEQTKELSTYVITFPKTIPQNRLAMMRVGETLHYIGVRIAEQDRGDGSFSIIARIKPSEVSRSFLETVDRTVADANAAKQAELAQSAVELLDSPHVRVQRSGIFMVNKSGIPTSENAFFKITVSGKAEDRNGLIEKLNDAFSKASKSSFIIRSSGEITVEIACNAYNRDFLAAMGEKVQSTQLAKQQR